MKKTNLKNKLSIVLCTVLIVAMALFTTGCGAKDDNSQSQPNSSSQINSSSQTESQSEQNEEKLTTKVYEDSAIIGEYSEDKNIVDVEIVTEDGKSSLFRIFTDKTTLGEALLDIELIAGEDSEYGLYVKTVNGVTADFDKDGSYWAFYIDGEYAQTGVDQTKLEKGKGRLYTFKIEK